MEPAAKRSLHVIAAGVSGIAVVDVFCMGVENEPVITLRGHRVHAALRLHVGYVLVYRYVESHSVSVGLLTDVCQASVSSIGAM